MDHYKVTQSLYIFLLGISSNSLAPDSTCMYKIEIKQHKINENHKPNYDMLFLPLSWHLPSQQANQKIEGKKLEIMLYNNLVLTIW
jgi:hypothetical protein